MKCRDKIMTNWTASDIPSQHGRSAVVTGTGGIGLEDALALARAGAEVIIAGRNPERGAAAVDKIRDSVPRAHVPFEVLDLGSLRSVAAFGKRLNNQQRSLDLLINNAAIMAPPRRLVTADGFELQFGTNYLGHFALTAHLLPLLRKGNKPRVVTLSSVADRDAVINFDDLQAEHGYKPMAVYGQSKLAGLMFALELQRRSDAAGWGIRSFAAHPGLARTNLIPNSSGWLSVSGALRIVLGPLFQSAAQAALPTLYAATAPDATPGRYYGPDGFRGVRGYPAAVKPNERALDEAAAARLWDISERLAGVTFGEMASHGRLQSMAAG
jgi:NAD(P)-dependent dehydrogenase (short-subunit alcohol dehydrogenase family)